MDREAMERLHITPKSNEELHAALRGFELKWQHKAHRTRGVGRVTRF